MIFKKQIFGINCFESGAWFEYWYCSDKEPITHSTKGLSLRLIRGGC